MLILAFFTEDEVESFFGTEAEQIKMNVLPTQTYYSFYCLVQCNWI